MANVPLHLHVVWWLRGEETKVWWGTVSLEGRETQPAASPQRLGEFG